MKKYHEQKLLLKSEVVGCGHGKSMILSGPSLEQAILANIWSNWIFILLCSLYVKGRAFSMVDCHENCGIWSHLCQYCSGIGQARWSIPKGVAFGKVVCE